MENTKSSSSGSVPAGSVGVDKTSLVPDTSAGAGELESIETQGKTPAEAIEKALAILRVDRSKVKVKIENSTFNLSSIGMAYSSGHYGETIEITNPASKRKLLGRIVDFNTVVIDL